MRYIVKKIEDGLFEFTHIEERETLEGLKVEVIKGRNLVQYDKMTETVNQLELDLAKTKELLLEKSIKERIKQYKEELKAEIDLLNNQIETLHKMIKEADKV